VDTGSPAGFELPGDGGQLYGLGVSDGDLRDLLAWVVRRAVVTLSQVDAASVSLGSPGEPELLVASSSLAQAADGAQFQASAGPVFDAFRWGTPIRTEDVTGDERWPALRGWAPDDDRVGGALAVPLVRHGAVAGVLAAYSRAPGRFGDDTVSGLRPFVVTAERLLRDDLRLAEVSLVNEQLARALTSRAVIDQAKGMIMAARRCGPDEAFDVLRRMSNRGNRKLRDVAAEMLADATRRP
jgi:GAF domain-containing protein